MFKENLKAYRLSAGLTVQELAEKVLCTKNYIGKLELGTREPNATMVSAICKALNCTPNDLLLDNTTGGEGD